jgi:hypothetical protein
MTFALGMFYVSYAALLCGTFDLAQQRTVGRYLLAACPVIVLVVIASTARALARERGLVRQLGGPIDVPWPSSRG